MMARHTVRFPVPCPVGLTISDDLSSISGPRVRPRNGGGSKQSVLWRRCLVAHHHSRGLGTIEEGMESPSTRITPGVLLNSSCVRVKPTEVSVKQLGGNVH